MSKCHFDKAREMPYVPLHLYLLVHTRTVRDQMGQNSVSADMGKDTVRITTIVITRSQNSPWETAPSKKSADAKEVTKTTFTIDEKYGIIKDCIAKEATKVHAESGMKGAKYFKVNEDGSIELLYCGKPVSMMKGLSGLFSPDGETQLATTRMKRSFGTDRCFCYSDKPVFDGQEPDPAAKVKKDDPDLYVSCVVVTSLKSWSAAEATLNIVEGYEDEEKKEYKLKPMYKSFKVAAMKFSGYVEDLEGVCVAKVGQVGGFSMATEFHIAEGMDIMAAIFLCSNLNPGSAGGALAGAGVT